MRSPKVSVIIPSYNQAAYLPTRIESVLNQTFADFELLILDDQSTDNSIPVIKQYQLADPRISTSFNETNSGGTFGQWEKGVRMARGEYIWIAESDDYADLRFLETLVPLLDQQPSVGLAYSNSVVVDNKGSYMDTWANRRAAICGTDKWTKGYTENGLVEIESLLLYHCTVNNASAVLFRKRALLPHLPTIASFRYVGDWYTYLRILIQADICYVHQDLNFYREHQHNASLQSYADGMQFIERYRCRALILPQLSLSKLAHKKLHLHLAYEYLNYLLTFAKRKIPSSAFLKTNTDLARLDLNLYRRVVSTLAGIGFRKSKKELSRLWSR